jgi:DMSO/TMAO reductase YedYZ molybdopterin-dependent catalytic subunit
MAKSSDAANGCSDLDAMRMVRPSPVCAETPLERQRGLFTPNALFYLRNNFPYPSAWLGLRVEGAVDRPAALDLADLSRFSRKRLTVTLECAGNGRAVLDPPVAGEQWGLGAVSTAEWSGTPLHELLGEVGISSRAQEVAFAGADRFARSLPVETALHPDTLLVTAMNGAPLPLEHGGPLRLLVPGWYGMASVKWLVSVAALTEPFTGHFQSERYVMDGIPVREMEVRAVITDPPAGALVAGRSFRVAGYAWTGRGHVVRVELSDDGGASWMETHLADAAPPYGWTRWERSWRPQRSGPAVLLVRAMDSTGRVQPQQQRWNQLGYCNNESVPHRLTVVEKKEVVRTDAESNNR